MSGWDVSEAILLVPVVGGSVYSILTLVAVLVYFKRTHASKVPSSSYRPPVTVLRPVCGLEKNLKENLRGICFQDYAEYQIVFSAQRAEDPAVPILYEIQKEFGTNRVAVVINDVAVGSNGKVNNLLGGITAAKHDLLVICDSDVVVPPDYLKTMVAPLSSPSVGLVCSLHKTVNADRWWEKLEVLSMNADYMPSVIFAFLTGAAKFCLGPSVAIRRSTLQELGGFEDLADYLAEDNELGCRVWGLGKQVVLSRDVIGTVVDMPSFKAWWVHQLYWDLNIRASNPGGFFATLFIRSVPFAVLFTIVRLADPFSLAVLIGTTGIRLASSALVLAIGFRDLQGLRSLPLLPLRDLLGFGTWVAALMKNTVVWRDKTYRLGIDGKMKLIRQDAGRQLNTVNEQALLR